MPNPIGDASYKGLAVPMFGDSVIEQENSSNVILTLVHTSANAGGFIQGMDFRADRASSLLTDLALWDVDLDGGHRVLSGTTVLMEIDSSGLYVRGGKQMFNSSGQTPVITINTTASTLLSSNSGKLHVLSTQAATSNFIYLPTAGLARQGDYWDLVSETTAVSLWNLAILGTSGQILAPTGAGTAIATTIAVDSTLSTGAMWWHVICISTVLPSYMVSNMLSPTAALTSAVAMAHTLGVGTSA